MSFRPNTIQHWPGGIPSSVLIHPDDERPEEDDIEDSRGWLLFVTVSQAGESSHSVY